MFKDGRISEAEFGIHNFKMNCINSVTVYWSYYCTFFVAESYLGDMLGNTVVI